MPADATASARLPPHVYRRPAKVISSYPNNYFPECLYDSLGLLRAGHFGREEEQTLDGTDALAKPGQGRAGPRWGAGLGWADMSRAEMGCPGVG